MLLLIFIVDYINIRVRVCARARIPVFMYTCIQSYTRETDRKAVLYNVTLCHTTNTTPPPISSQKEENYFKIHMSTPIPTRLQYSGLI